MTTEDKKQLLLQDFCGRMAYGVKITDGLHITTLKVRIDTAPATLAQFIHSEHLRYYLRSMDSMTEEEAKELSILYGLKDILSIKKITDEYIEVVVDDGFCSTETRAIWYDEIISSIEIFDWLNAHYFDYRNLIERGLAIAVTEENNPYKN